ncbi:unnamed protein product [Durusdinium trenchii]|uniref:Uncharacterized protein n=1 Tax=Durusdinium trenchii TaxID=1381693 RepID=A0ABP0RSD2_9DINO|eukprot:g27057.t1
MAVLEMLLGDWREESSANQIQVTHNLEKGYQVLVQRPGRRRGRRFAAYVGSDGNVYRGCYVLDPTESTRDRQLWRLRSDLNEGQLLDTAVLGEARSWALWSASTASSLAIWRSRSVTCAVCGKGVTDPAHHWPELCPHLGRLSSLTVAIS